MRLSNGLQSLSNGDDKGVGWAGTGSFAEIKIETNRSTPKTNVAVKCLGVKESRFMVLPLSKA